MRPCPLASLILALLATAFGAGCTGDVEPIVAPERPTAVPTQPGDGVEPTRGSETEAPPTTAPPTPEATSVAVPAGAKPLVARAREDLARRLDLSPDAIRLLSVEAVEWPDAGLGCPQHRLLYPDVVTPGFRIVLEAKGQTYEYHTDEIRATLCAEGQDLDDETSLSPPESARLPIFVHVVQTYLLSGATLGTPLDSVPPNTVFAFDAASQTLHLRPSIVVFPETQVLVGQTTVIKSPGRSDVMGELFQVPGSDAPFIEVISVDGETDALTLTVGDQVFELPPGQSRSFKSTPDKAADVVTIVTSAGRPASIAPLPDRPGPR